MAKRKSSVTKDSLKEVCKAHTELTEAIKSHRSRNDSSPILQEMYELQLRELETKITKNLKSWIGI